MIITRKRSYCRQDHSSVIQYVPGTMPSEDLESFLLGSKWLVNEQAMLTARRAWMRLDVLRGRGSMEISR